MVEFTAPGPSWNVEVGIGTGTPQYLTFVWAIYGHDAGPWWEALGDLLGGRPGWHCDFTNQGLLWSYGALGSSLFNISAPSAPDDSSEPSDYQSGTYVLFDYDADVEHGFSDLAELRAWLEQNEPRHVDHARTVGQMVASDGWSMLAGLTFDARVTYEGGTWIATVPKLPLEAAFAGDLVTVVAHVRELVAGALGAPAELASTIEIQARLTPAATRALPTT